MSERVPIAEKGDAVSEHRSRTPEPAPARRFRLAALALAGTFSSVESPQGDPSAQAAQALVSLALAEESAVLRQLLRPDPRRSDVSWTVACYQVGDLTPTALRDFSDPAPAVLTLVGCNDPSHVAGELLASTHDGLRWAALTRSGEALAFRLPGPDTASEASDGGSGELAGALEAWAEQFRRWATHGGDDPTSADNSSPVDQVAAGAPDDRAVPGDGYVEMVATALATIAARLDTLDAQLSGLRREVRAIERCGPSTARLIVDWVIDRLSPRR